MGYYVGQRENPCPRCGGIVVTLFISVSPMSFSQKCENCGTDSFSEEEEKLLGANGNNINAEPKGSSSI
jgi:ribosomal protein S27AE